MGSISSLLRDYVFDKSAKINTKNGIYKLGSSFTESYYKANALNECKDLTENTH
jgi:hypothetical protein